MRNQRRPSKHAQLAAAAASWSTYSGASPAMQQSAFRLQENWVLPPRGQSRGIIHFLGGAFVGSAPNLTYPLLLRLLSEGGYSVVATPYAVTFQHAECCLAVRQDFDSVVQQLRASATTAWLADESLPVFGVGHSNGALLHLLAGSLVPAPANHRGDVLISFNNREVTEAIPVPLTSLQPLVRSVRLTSGLQSIDSERALQTLAALAPSGVLDAATVESLVSVLDQLDLVLREVEDGADAFTPSPTESRAIISGSYAAAATLLVQFLDDSIDETPEVESLLRQRNNDVTVLRLPGSHVTPCGGGAADVKIGRTFTPADAVGLVLRRVAEEGTRRLAFQILRWLDRQTGLEG